MKKKRFLDHLTPNERAVVDKFVRRLHARYADQILQARLFDAKVAGYQHQEGN